MAIKTAVKTPSSVIIIEPYLNNIVSPLIKKMLRTTVKQIIIKIGLRPLSTAFGFILDTARQVIRMTNIKPYAGNPLAINNPVIYVIIRISFVRGSSL